MLSQGEAWSCHLKMPKGEESIDKVDEHPY